MPGPGAQGSRKLYTIKAGYFLAFGFDAYCSGALAALLGGLTSEVWEREEGGFRAPHARFKHLDFEDEVAWRGTIGGLPRVP